MNQNDLQFFLKLFHLWEMFFVHLLVFLVCLVTVHGTENQIKLKSTVSQVSNLAATLANVILYIIRISQFCGLVSQFLWTHRLKSQIYWLYLDFSPLTRKDLNINAKDQVFFFLANISLSTIFISMVRQPNNFHLDNNKVERPLIPQWQRHFALAMLPKIIAFTYKDYGVWNSWMVAACRTWSWGISDTQGKLNLTFCSAFQVSQSKSQCKAKFNWDKSIYFGFYSFKYPSISICAV